MIGRYLSNAEVAALRVVPHPVMRENFERGLALAEHDRLVAEAREENSEARGFTWTACMIAGWAGQTARKAGLTILDQPFQADTEKALAAWWRRGITNGLATAVLPAEPVPLRRSAAP